MLKDKRNIINECLQDRHTSADAILNALHQGGWQIIPNHPAPLSNLCVCVAICRDRDPDGEGVCKGLPQ